MYNTTMTDNLLSKEHALIFLKKLMGAPKRELDGKERERVWLLIQMSTPINKSNNQRFWYEEYLIGSRRYDVTYGVDEEPIIEVHEE